MACADTSRNVLNNKLEVPQWKKELIVDLKTYARTLTSSSGSIKLTVTCPKAMRPILKKQVSQKDVTKQSVVPEANILFKKVEINKLKENLKKTEEHLKSIKKPIRQSNEIKKKTGDENEEIPPKLGLVQTLKSKYQSMMLQDKSNIERRSVSFENVLDDRYSLREKPRRRQSFSTCCITKQAPQKPNNQTSASQKTSKVKQTKQIFESIEKKRNTQIRESYLFLESNKPQLPPKPKMIIKKEPSSFKQSLDNTNRLQMRETSIVRPQDKPPLSPKPQVISTQKPFFKKTLQESFKRSPLGQPFPCRVTTPTSPLKSGRNLY